MSPFPFLLQLHTSCAVVQAGQAAAVPVSVLRQQPNFLANVAACIPSGSTAVGSTEPAETADVLHCWEDRDDLAWQIVAEAHALDILAVEAFVQPRARPGLFADAQACKLHVHLGWISKLVEISC